jgi:hypothetical protein
MGRSFVIRDVWFELVRMEHFVLWHVQLRIHGGMMVEDRLCDAFNDGVFVCEKSIN